MFILMKSTWGRWFGRFSSVPSTRSGVLLKYTELRVALKAIIYVRYKKCSHNNSANLFNVLLHTELLSYVATWQNEASSDPQLPHSHATGTVGKQALCSSGHYGNKYEIKEAKQVYTQWLKSEKFHGFTFTRERKKLKYTRLWTWDIDS